MESGFKLTDTQSRSVLLSYVVIALVTAAHVIAVAHGVLTIDMARDLYWAMEIADGRAYPMFGPPVGSFEILGPAWFYLAAVAVKLSGSMVTYFTVLGSIAALKYLLVYRVGVRWINGRFALWLVVATALPGIATYQMVGVGHPQMLEVAIWAGALCLLRLRAQPDSRRDALGTGLIASLALHAHPTAILLLPWAVLGVLMYARASWRSALAWASLGALLPVVPRIALWMFPALGVTTPDNAPAVAGLGGSVTGVLAIGLNLLWYQPLYVVKTLISASDAAVRIWQIAWVALLMVTSLGLLVAIRDRTTRSTAVAAMVTLILAIVTVAALRDHTPFYMLNALLPPLSILLAISWCSLQGKASGFVRALFVALVVLCVPGVFLLATFGTVQVARAGMVDSYLPLHSNMQDTTTRLHVESVHSVGQRDAVTQWFCARRDGGGGQTLSLHGDLAVAMDVGVALDFRFACPTTSPVVLTGGRAEPYVGMPVAAWAAAGLTPATTRQGTGWTLATRVIMPEAALPAVSGRTYPPRLATMLDAARAGSWQRELMATQDETLVVSSLLSTSPLLTVTAYAGTVGAESSNRVEQVPIFRVANTWVFRCDRCGAGDVAWRIVVQAGLPETTSIVTVRQSR